MAWQLSDDILDVASESAQSGKTPGTDLREGVRSLPVLHALRSSRPVDARLRELLDSGDLTDTALHAEALGLLRENPAMRQARADLERWAAIAREEIAGLPDVPGAGRVRGALRLRGGAYRLTGQVLRFPGGGPVSRAARARAHDDRATWGMWLRRDRRCLVVHDALRAGMARPCRAAGGGARLPRHAARPPPPAAADLRPVTSRAPVVMPCCPACYRPRWSDTDC